MTKFPRNVEGYEGSLEELAKSIGKMTYDQTSVFIEKLADDIKRQADVDFSRGRKKLAYELHEVSRKLYQAKEKMDLVWKICEPYMKDYI